jgi:4-hydroxy-2-oxoheptanedioate aldolase
MAAACGFDAIYVDLEHSSTSLETASMLCVAATGAGLIPLVRVPSHAPETMTRALDTGAHGIIVPHVETATQAQDIVDVCRFRPAGKRSAIGPNAVNRYQPGSISGIVDFCEAQTIVAVMLESPLAIENANEIASIAGIDLVLIGAFDLSEEMGLLCDFTDAQFRGAVSHLTDACRTHGKTAGIAGIADMALLTDFVSLGIRFISAGTETGLFMDAARARQKALRTISVPPFPA